MVWLKRKAAGNLLPALSALLFILSGMLLWSLFTANAPVTAFMKGEVVQRTANSATLRVSGYKILDCHLVVNSFVGWYLNDEDEWAEATESVEFPNDATPNSTRPTNWWRPQRFGLFLVAGIPKDADTARVTAKHLCKGDSIPRITINGPWYIGAFEGEQ